MTAPLLSLDSELYPSPHEWRPERFLDNPQLSKQSLTFSRGTRICLGVRLHSFLFIPILPCSLSSSSLQLPLSADFLRTSRLTCKQMNLAYSEIYIFIAAIFRRYNIYDPAASDSIRQQISPFPSLELFETTRADVDIDSDFAIPLPKEGSRGVRVIVRT